MKQNNRKIALWVGGVLTLLCLVGCGEEQTAEADRTEKQLVQETGLQSDVEEMEQEEAKQRSDADEASEQISDESEEVQMSDIIQSVQCGVL